MLTGQRKTFFPSEATKYTCGISPDIKPTGRITPPHAILQSKTENKINEMRGSWSYWTISLKGSPICKGLLRSTSVILNIIIITYLRKHSLKTSPPTDSIITFAPFPAVISFT